MPKRRLKGKIVSVKMEKTVVVRVGRRYAHPRYRKVVEDHKKYYAHSDQKHVVGEEVTIEECRPLSKLKRWKVVETSKKGRKLATDRSKSKQ